MSGNAMPSQEGYHILAALAEAARENAALKAKLAVSEAAQLYCEAKLKADQATSERDSLADRYQAIKRVAWRRWRDLQETQPWEKTE